MPGALCARTVRLWSLEGWTIINSVRRGHGDGTVASGVTGALGPGSGCEIRSCAALGAAASGELSRCGAAALFENALLLSATTTPPA